MLGCHCSLQLFIEELSKNSLKMGPHAVRQRWEKNVITHWIC